MLNKLVVQHYPSNKYTFDSAKGKINKCLSVSHVSFKVFKNCLQQLGSKKQNWNLTSVVTENSPSLIRLVLVKIWLEIFVKPVNIDTQVENKVKMTKVDI